MNRKEQTDLVSAEESPKEEKTNLFGFFDLLLKIEKRSKRKNACIPAKLKSSRSKHSKDL